jgi:hypothetical protein
MNERMEEGKAIIVYVLAKGKRIFHCVFSSSSFFLLVCVILCFNVFKDVNIKRKCLLPQRVLVRRSQRAIKEEKLAFSLTVH